MLRFSLFFLFLLLSSFLFSFLLLLLRNRHVVPDRGTRLRDAPYVHHSPCMTTTPTSVGNPAVTVEQTNTVSTTANANFAQIGQVPAALQLQNPIPTPMTAPVSSRSTGYANMNINPNLPDSRYFVSRVQNVGPLSKRRRTPQQQPQPTPG